MPEKTHEPRGWMEFELRGPVMALEVFADFMTGLGAGGAIFSEDPHSAGGQMVTAFLPLSRMDEALLSRIHSRVEELREDFPGKWSGLLTSRVVADQDWGEEWKRSLKPERLPPGLWIIPTFCEVPEEAQGEPILRLDPGLAFGTGQHITTRLCLPPLAAAVREGADSVLDVGTGTGILAMAAARFGARRILALDIDPVALRVAEDNLRRNGLAEVVRLRHGVSDPRLVLDDPPFQVIVANLFAEALVELLPFLNRHLAAGGTLILSGLLSDRTAKLEKDLMENRLTMADRREEDGWIRIVARNH